ncbi:MAG: hypothetical protein Q8O94_01200, partial [bacterium]|nr:hypothetical protein [bacterium]
MTYADLKSLMNLEKAAITDYPPLGVINTSMITAFEEYLGRKLNNESRTETQHIGGFARYMIRLPAVPITAMTSVTVTEGGIATVWTETDDYDIMGYGIKLFVPIKNCKIVI